MSIDPRTMKAMLQAQLAPNLDFRPLSKKSSQDQVDNKEASLFNKLLSAQISGQTSIDETSDTNVPVWSNEIWAQVAQYGITEATPLEVSSNQSLSATALQGTPFANLIGNAASKYGVDPSLIHAVIATESGFNPQAESHAGAKGLMQLMDGTARGLGVSNSFDPEQNVDGGTRYLSLLMKKYDGNELVALAAYNAGPGRIDRLSISTNEELQANLHELPRETQRYIVKVQEAKL
ncbi:transglycosylase SLT domain-containing protein [Paenibacillus sp. GSMTC-2017]|uniref:lytic transglycosylase domain-containing protein n=1 Tax=Paenibacillus sp. GSMTC-2017 TaxID=2794350 RepID=UPI0018D614A2|nr:lytic transglycosylase domain-containing protein [Paenibacillus sp. GSMTC-2017]MBH5316933.1 transglycosylase SLT domain-containing protein [Paenibacillus sp. GSMTC-2017]